MDSIRALNLINEIRSEWYTPKGSKKLSNETLIAKARTSWAFDEIYLHILADDGDNPIDVLENLQDLSEQMRPEMGNVLWDVCSNVIDIIRAAGDGL